MYKKIAIALLGLVMTFSFFHTSRAADEWPASGVHKALTQTPKWLNTSRDITAEDLKGRLILVDFWTFCCINCIHVIPKLQRIEREFGDNLTVIGVHSAKFLNEQDSNNIRAAILRYGIEHPVVNDDSFAIWRTFGVRAWPTLLLISPAGHIIEQYPGEGDEDEIKADIRKALKRFDGQVVKDALPIDLEKNKIPPTVLSFPGKVINIENFNGNQGLAISDSSHHRILITDHDGNAIETIGSGDAGLKDGDFATAQFNGPQGMAFKDNILYVADTTNHALRAVDFNTKQVTTLSGTGERGTILNNEDVPATGTAMASPWDLAFYPDENTLAIAMAGTHQLWTYNINNKTVSVLAGNGRESIDDGAYPRNSLSQPSGLSVYNNKLYFVDSETSSLRVLEDGKIKTLIGTGLFDFGLEDGPQGKALMQHTLGLTATKDGVYLADSYNHAIRHYDYESGKLTTITGNGAVGELNEPNAIIPFADKFLITDTNNNRLVTLDPKTKTVAMFDVNLSEETAVDYTAPDQLPNVKTLPQEDLTENAALELIFNKGWGLNETAPTYLGLFNSKQQHIKTFDRTALEKGIELPIEAGQTYTLQGTLYYCPKANPNQCLVASIQQPLSVKGIGSNKLTINLSEN